MEIDKYAILCHISLNCTLFILHQKCIKEIKEIKSILI